MKRKVNINNIEALIRFIKLIPEFFAGNNDDIEIFDEFGIVDNMKINDLVDFDSG